MIRIYTIQRPNDPDTGAGWCTAGQPDTQDPDDRHMCHFNGALVLDLDGHINPDSTDYVRIAGWSFSPCWFVPLTELEDARAIQEAWELVQDGVVVQLNNSGPVRVVVDLVRRGVAIYSENDPCELPNEVFWQHLGAPEGAA